mmetsp:Transcript_78154/g.203660  ORF Transcript_78154/g.203660 Transcript_78154/m.203660 type:complete len:374 (+) Transcript_78154:700-1821(+)
MGELVSDVHLSLHQPLVEPNTLEEVPHLLQPGLLLGSEIRLFVDEVLNLHLLELPGSKQELPWGDFVAERLPDLRNAERDFHTRDGGHVLIIGEDALRSLWPQVTGGARVCVGAHLGLKHKVERPRPGQRAGLACGGRRHQRHILLCGLCHVLHLQRLQRRVRPTFLHEFLRRLLQLGLGVAVLDRRDATQQGAVFQLHSRPHQLICTEPLLALGAVHHGVREIGHMARCLVHLRIGDDGTVEPDDIVAPVDHSLPPAPFKVVLQLHAQRTVVEETSVATVDLATLKYEPPSLAEAHQTLKVYLVIEFLHLLRWRVHGGHRAGDLESTPGSGLPGPPGERAPGAQACRRHRRRPPLAYPAAWDANAQGPARGG